MSCISGLYRAMAFSSQYHITEGKGTDMLDLLTDVKSTDPIHFLWTAVNPATRCVKDTARPDDRQIALSEFA